MTLFHQISNLFSPSLEASQEELEELERVASTIRQKKRVRKLRKNAKSPPRDELGRFTRLKKGKSAGAAR